MSEIWRIPGCQESPDWRIDMPALYATFPWLEPLGECPQDPIFHAEGDVLTHLGILRGKVIDLSAAYKARLRVVYVEPPIPLIRERNGDRVKRVPERVWERLFDMPTAAECHQVEYLVDDV